MTPTALIVTLQMEAGAAARFTALRQAHFPPERNWLQAHITLFHALPLASLDTVLHDAAELAAGTDAMALQVERVHFLGAGVAYAMASDAALRLRAALAARWEPLLGRQDRAWHGPLHVTVQNKVHHLEARRLQAALEREFMPHAVQAIGLQVWYYVGGPWQPVASFAFGEGAAGAGPAAAG